MANRVELLIPVVRIIRYFYPLSKIDISHLFLTDFLTCYTCIYNVINVIKDSVCIIGTRNTHIHYIVNLS